MNKPPKEQKGEKGLTVAAANRPALALVADLASRVAPNVERYLLRGLEGSDNTRLAYSSDLRIYETYCELHQLAPWPAALETLAGYVAHLADVGRKLATINRHLAAIEKNHQLLGMPSAINEPALDVLRKGVAREIGKKQKQAPAFSVPHLKRTIDRLDLSRPDGLRARALLLLGFTGAFRRSELVGLNLEHIKMVHDAADEVLVVTLPKSKANQTGDIEQKVIFYAENAAYCPIEAYKAWVALLAGRTQGPLFVSLKRGRPGEPGKPADKRLADRRVNLLVKEHLGAKYSAHSLRVAFITTAKLAGQSNDFIKNQTKQKTDAMISRYTRLDDIIKYNAGRSLGL